MTVEIPHTNHPPVPQPPSPRPGMGGWGRSGALLVAGLGAAGLATAALLDPVGIQHGPELCLFRRLTGLPCPGCGLTRSWVMTAHGDLGQAFSFNLFGPLTFAAAALVVLGALWLVITGRGPRRAGAHGRMPRWGVRVLIGLLVLFLVYGVARGADAGFGWGLFPAVT
ncbi:DUF2752 domain-containing protein [Gordonia sp. NB41Y]|uniref:DUF2752 domain-containing protein n=1 Tax=Gordonia sp. NB41Y TaxID=875808 RepID=UPI0006B16112|nr:DUF2752 domain-containing protein [Gordonia sp. NB41Y]WLP89897.1 DUF2752 domain-containing protein [Gordonia sp. NB41Y]